MPTFSPIPMKSRTMQDLNIEQRNADVIAQFNTKNETLFRFAQSINFFENKTVNDFSEDKEIISYAEWIKKARNKLNKGFTVMVAESGIKNIEDICWFTKNRLSTQITELANNLDQINQFLEERQSDYDELKEENFNLKDTNHQLESQIDQLNSRLTEHKQVLREAYDIIEVVLDEKTLESIEEQKNKQKKLKIIKEARETLDELNDEEELEDEESEPSEPSQTPKTNPPPNNSAKKPKRSWLVEGMQNKKT